MKVLYDLLISVSKAERQEAKMKVWHDSMRLGNVGVIRAGTVISEAWEDGQTLKDLNAQLEPFSTVCGFDLNLVAMVNDASDSSCSMDLDLSLLETKEAIERQRKSLKKIQSGSSST